MSAHHIILIDASINKLNKSKLEDLKLLAKQHNIEQIQGSLYIFNSPVDAILFGQEAYKTILKVTPTYIRATDIDQIIKE